MDTQKPQQGQLETIEFGGKVVAVKRRCSCGGDVIIKKAPDGNGNIATCKQCGVSLTYGQKNS